MIPDILLKRKASIKKKIIPISYWRTAKFNKETNAYKF